MVSKYMIVTNILVFFSASEEKLAKISLLSMKEMDHGAIC